MNSADMLNMKGWFRLALLLEGERGPGLSSPSMPTLMTQ